MINYWGHSDDMFDQGYKALRKGILAFGTFLTVLGALIFMFPKLIAFIIASFILFAGLSVLVLGYRFWKLQNQVRPFEWEDEPVDVEFTTETPRQQRKTITFILK